MTIDPNVLSTIPTAYSAVRPDIRNGDIALFHGDEPFSKVIQTFTHGPWSHVGFVWRMDEIDRVMLLESVDHLGVRLIPLSSKLNGNEASPPYTGQMILARHAEFPTDVSSDVFKRMTEFAVDKVGCPYSAQDIVDIGMRIMVGFAGVTEGKDLLPQKSYICSEYAYECYKSVGIEIVFNQERFVSPNDFALDRKVQFVAHVSPDPT